MPCDHASRPDDVEHNSVDEERYERCGWISHMIYRFCLHPQQSRECSRYAVHSEDEVALPNLLENARERGCHGLADVTKEFGKDPFIGEFLIVDGMDWWVVTGTNIDGTYDIHHDEDDHLSRASMPREVVEMGIDQHRQRMKSKCARVRAILPAWAIHPDANPSLPRSVGPSIPLARAAVVGMLITQVVLLGLALTSSACSGNGLAVYSGWVILAMVPIDIVRVIAEWHILKPALINFAQGLGFHLFGILEVPFVVWLACVFGVSQLSFSDICTDSLFTGLALRSIARDATLDRIWYEAWQVSMFNWVWTPSLSAMIAMAWLLSTFQMLWPLLWSIRRSDLPCTTRHEVGSCGMSPSVTSLLHSEETTISNLWHTDVLFALADAGGLASLQSMNIPRYARLHRQAEADMFSSSTCSLLRGTEIFADIVVERIFLSYILEDCIQINLQATMYAMVIASWRLRGIEEEFQVRALVSVVICIVVSFLKLAEAYSFNKVVQSA